ncbi:MAG: peptidoglycan-associated lipoprotein Pal [Pseudomonadota bacterium]
MHLKSVSLVCALAMLGACAFEPENSADVSAAGEGRVTGVNPPLKIEGLGEGLGNSSVSSTELATLDTSPLNVESVTPGSEQEFVVNVGDRVYFGYDSSDLTSEAQATLRLQADWLTLYPTKNIEIEGHADERGTREYNLALGDRRSNSVRDFLVSLGVSTDRIQTISYGKERPAVLGSGDAIWALNRRGVTRIR